MGCSMPPDARAAARRSAPDAADPGLAPDPAGATDRAATTAPGRPAAPPADGDAGDAFAGPSAGTAAGPPRRRRHWRRWLVAPLVVALLAALALAARGAGGPGGAPAPAPSPTAVRFDARGRVVPIRQARVITLQGGVVRALPRVPGAAVAAGDELARIESPAGATEVLAAPYAGTVLAQPVQVGDGLLAGGQVAVVGDLSELRVETTDVDEYLVGTLRVGQPAEISVDALGERILAGRVVAITLLPQQSSGGDLQYPVLVSLGGGDPALRPGMTARLRFRRVEG